MFHHQISRDRIRFLPRFSPISSTPRGIARNWSTSPLPRSITSPFTSRGNRHGSVEDGTPLFPSATDLLPTNGGQSIVLSFPPDSLLR